MVEPAALRIRQRFAILPRRDNGPWHLGPATSGPQRCLHRWAGPTPSLRLWLAQGEFHCIVSYLPLHVRTASMSDSNTDIDRNLVGSEINILGDRDNCVIVLS